MKLHEQLAQAAAAAAKRRDEFSRMLGTRVANQSRTGLAMYEPQTWMTTETVDSTKALAAYADEAAALERAARVLHDLYDCAARVDMCSGYAIEFNAIHNGGWRVERDNGDDADIIAADLPFDEALAMAAKLARGKEGGE